MPAFSKLAGRSGLATGFYPQRFGHRDFREPEVATGDAAAGAAISNGKGGCVNCHQVYGKGTAVDQLVGCRSNQ